jgi:hypothetical protein
MTAAPATVQLRKIIEGVGGRCKVVVSDDELAVFAAALAGWRDGNVPPRGWWENPGEFSVCADGVRHSVPVHLQHAVERGQVKPAGPIGRLKRRKRKWHDLAPDIAAWFRRMSPGQEFGDRDGPVARFVAAVIPLAFPDQNPDVGTVGQYLARHQQKQKTRARR